MLLDKGIPASYILNKVKFDFVYVFFISMTVLFLTNRFGNFLPVMPIAIPAFIGTAISILLSFKLNQSYDRWWEARKIWGSIVNDSRSLVIQLQSFLPEQMQNNIRKMALRQIGWCYCLGQSLRGQPATENLEGLVDSEELAIIANHNNKPLALIQCHAKDLKQLKQQQQLELFAQVQLDDTLVRLCASQGKAERIKTTVFPRTYRLFLHSIIYLFVITLSIAIRDISWYFEVPLLVLISCAFFLLEKSATHMQDPFQNRPTDTAMTAIARTIEINIKQLINEPNIPAPIAPTKFYLS